MEVVDGAVAVADFIGGTGGDGGGDIFLGEAGGIVEVGTFCEIGCYCRGERGEARRCERSVSAL